VGEGERERRVRGSKNDEKSRRVGIANEVNED
jgi:hypothetical protein